MSSKVFQLECGAFRIYVSCNSEKTQNGFKHIAHCVPFGNDRPEHDFTRNMYYLNRTWETFEFESVLLDCLNVLIEREYNSMKSDFMRVNGYKRLNAGRKAVLQEHLNNWYRYTDLQEIKEKIKRGDFE